MIGAAFAVIILILGAQLVQSELARRRERQGSQGRTKVPFQALFDSLSTSHGVPSRLMEAVVEVESAYNPRAVNLESAADQRRGRNVDSLGLGQILWPDTALAIRPGTAREQLFDPEINLCIAFSLMASLLRAWPTLDASGFPARAVASYNAGAPRFNPDGTLRNQPYVDKVKKAWLRLT